jgi:hypothetical protein
VAVGSLWGNICSSEKLCAKVPHETTAIAQCVGFQAQQVDDNVLCGKQLMTFCGSVSNQSRRGEWYGQNLRAVCVCLHGWALVFPRTTLSLPVDHHVESRGLSQWRARGVGTCRLQFIHQLFWPVFWSQQVVRHRHDATGMKRSPRQRNNRSTLNAGRILELHCFTEPPDF